MINRINNALKWRIEKFKLLINDINFIKKRNVKISLNNHLKYGTQNNLVTYYKMIDLYCATNGKYLHDLHKIVQKKFQIKKHLDPKLKSIILAQEGTDIKESFKIINQNLINDGYHKLNTKLDDFQIEELIKITENCKTTFAPNYTQKVFYDSSNIKSEIYKYEASDILNNEFVQKLIIDPGLIQICTFSF